MRPMFTSADTREIILSYWRSALRYAVSEDPNSAHYVEPGHYRDGDESLYVEAVLAANPKGPRSHVRICRNGSLFLMPIAEWVQKGYEPVVDFDAHHFRDELSSELRKDVHFYCITGGCSVGISGDDRHVPVESLPAYLNSVHQLFKENNIQCEPDTLREVAARSLAVRT